MPGSTYRQALGASLADVKSDLEKTRRLAREAAESARKDAEDALERQVTTTYDIFLTDMIPCHTLLLLLL